MAGHLDSIIIIPMVRKHVEDGKTDKAMVLQKQKWRTVNTAITDNGLVLNNLPKGPDFKMDAAYNANTEW